MRRLSLTSFVCLAVLACGAAPAGAQVVPGFDTVLASRLQCEGEQGKRHCTLVGSVELQRDDWKFYADHAEYFEEKVLLVARGNVAFTQGTNRISADRAEFNTDNRTGTFFVAFGSATLADRAERHMLGGQEPDMYFYGETIEKIGDRKYKVTKGGFTTCVQPTPRWELTSGSAVLSLEHYALLRNTVLKVKDVPMFYLPAMYYPLKKENRATGFLLPMYGTSTYQGFHLANAFFWAIGRSHDATFLHDFYANTGQGVGGEYRYVLSPGSQGDARVYLLNERPVETTNASGQTSTQAGRKSYEIRANVAQSLGRYLRARGRIDYFSNITVQQLYNTNIYNASRRQRLLSTNLSGNFGAYLLSASYDRTEYFFGTSSSTLVGSTPRVTFNRSERPLGGAPLYFSLNTDFSHLPRVSRAGDTEVDTSLSRLHVTPTLRVPFTRWPFLTINSSVAWHGTYWTERRDEEGAQVDEGITRRYFDLQARITGPVLNRVFNTPDSGYAEKLKHSIEPYVNVQYVTPIDHFDAIVQNDYIDTVVGRVMRFAYGVTNHLYAKRRTGGPEGSGVSREILNVTLGQSYYTDARAAQYDRSYSTTFNGYVPSKFTPIALTVRAFPTDEVNATMRAEYDQRFGSLRSITANGGYSYRDVLQATGGWTHTFFIKDLPGFNDPNRLSNYLTGTLNLQLADNRVGGAYVFNYDLMRPPIAGVAEPPRRGFLQQRLVGFYNAQCCGFSVEYQVVNFQGTAVGSQLPRDKRLNFSFTLAGLGTFSNFFGAMGGAGR